MYNPPSSLLSFHFITLPCNVWPHPCVSQSIYFSWLFPSIIPSHKKRQLFSPVFNFLFFLLLVPLSSSFPPIHSIFLPLRISHSLPSKFPSVHDNAPQFPLLMFPNCLAHSLASGHVLKLANNVLKTSTLQGKKVTGQDSAWCYTCANTVGSSSGSPVSCW